MMDVKPIISVCLSFAEMMGALLETGGRLDYRLPIPGRLADKNTSADKDIPADEGIFSFQRVGDDIVAMNCMDVPVRLSFPSTDYCLGKVVTVPSKRNVTITPEVAAQTKALNTKFEMTVGVGVKILSSLKEGEEETVFCASGKVLREIKGAVNLCNEISVEMIDEDLYIRACSPYVLKGVSLLEITFQNGSPRKRLQNLEQAAFPVPSLAKDKSVLYLPNILPDSSSDIDVAVSTYCSLKNNRNSF